MDATDFDFWLGSWTCTDPADGAVGANRISRVLGGKVLEEVFSITSATGQVLNGRSYTVLDPVRGWCQTWVDDQGSYLDFTGEPTPEGMVLARPGARMVFRDVTPAGFTWDWEKETADSWEPSWRLLYTVGSESQHAHQVARSLPTGVGGNVEGQGHVKVIR
jgi:hypothetical protein